VLRGGDASAGDTPGGAAAASEKSGGPAIAVPIPGTSGTAGALCALRRRGAEAFDGGQVDALSTLAALTSIALRNVDLVHAQRNFFAHVTELLSVALDNHLDYHRGHGKRVAQLAHLIGRELGMADEAMQRLHFAALLHDLGMLKLERTQKMNPKACERHSLIGARMLAPIVLWQEVAPIVHSHHERWDGRGYPDGLAGDSIPLESRIIALADSYDSIASHSSYRVALARNEALREIRECTGTQFDPKVAAAFLALAERGDLGPEE
jgi:putative nucleotidyltransferase with HDIG domain